MAFAFAGIRFTAAQAPGLSTRSVIYGDRKNVGNASLAFLKKDSFPRRILAGNSSYEPDSASTTVAASGKVLLPGGESDGLSSSTDSIGNPEVSPDDLQVLQESAGLSIKDDSKIEAGQTPMSSEVMDDEIMNEGAKQSVHSQANQTIEKVEEKPRFIPPPGSGQRIYEIDPCLEGHRGHLDYRYSQYKNMRGLIDQYEGGLDAFSRGYEKFGFVRSADGITYREWAPGAKSAALIGDFNNWNPNADVMNRVCPCISSNYSPLHARLFAIFCRLIYESQTLPIWVS